MATQTEKDRIQSHLLDYANEIDAEILVARDYGSRARNLESESSDYDVMFVFVQRPEEYAVGTDTDTYTKSITPIDSELADIELHGWSLKKFIGNDGLVGSNPTAIQFAHSDEEYMIHTERGIRTRLYEMMQHASNQFKPYALINHLRSLVASHYGKYIEGDYKLADGVNYKDFVDIDSEIPHEYVMEEAFSNYSVDEERSRIGEQHVEVFGETHVEFGLGGMDIESALDDGLIEETTTDRRIKKYLTMCHELVNARIIEEEHTLPTMNFVELIDDVSDKEWMDDDVYDQITHLISAKKNDRGDREVDRIDVIDEFVEAELSRDIDPEGHVERSPDREKIYRLAREIYYRSQC